MANENLLTDVVVFLASAVVMVPLSRFLGLGSVLGYLVAGIVIGPWGLQFIKSADEILHFSEFGVVLLLFLIGLELNPKRLWEMRKPIFGLGGAQIGVSWVLLTLVGLWIGVPSKTAIIAGFGLSLSSTAIALQILSEKSLLNAPLGKASFAILLFQDLTVIPFLTIIPMLSAATAADVSSASWQTSIGKVIAVLGAIIIVGRFLIGPIFAWIARSRVREVFTAFSLLLVVGIAWLMSWINISMALGTFLAGVLLAESEYRHELEANIEPFKGLLLGLFFISVGMSLDFSVLRESWVIVFGLVAVVMVIKSLVLIGLTKLAGLSWLQSGLFGIVLSQSGEFVFVLLSLSRSLQVIPEEHTKILTAVVALSMFLTPILLIAYDRIVEPRLAKVDSQTSTPFEPTNPQSDQIHPVLIAGFGRFGQIVARFLHANRVATTVIDHSPEVIERVRKFGYVTFYGDATREELLLAAGIEKAKVFVIAIDNRVMALNVARLVKHRFPHVRIIARAWDMIHCYELLDLGVADFERETFHSAISLGEKALVSIGFSKYHAHRSAIKFKAYDAEALEKLYLIHKNQDEFVVSARAMREEMEKLFNKDEEVIESGSIEKSWS